MKKLLSLNIQKFAEFNANITDLIKKFTADDKFDADGANKSLNENIVKYNSKNQPKVETLKAKAIEDLVTGLGYENVTNVNQLKAYVSTLSSDEKSQDLIDMTDKYNTLNTKYDVLETDHNVITKKNAVYENESFIAGKTPNVDVDYLTFKINKLPGETFQEKYDAFMTEETNKQYFTPATPGKTTTTTGKARVVPQTSEISGVRQALIDKGLITPK